MIKILDNLTYKLNYLDGINRSNFDDNPTYITLH